MAEDESTDPAQAFAALMSGAAQQAAPSEDGEARWGYTVDRVTGERRPKKAPGRPRTPPSLDELKAQREEAQSSESPVEPPEDRAPTRLKGKRHKHGSAEPGKADEPIPQHRPGVISKGMAKMYRRTGKIIKAMDRDIGVAVIECADDCGEAWEELARVNPRVRRFALKLISGGAYGQLLMAHAPIFMAVIMKDGIRKHIPMMNLMQSMMEPDEDASDEEKANALTPQDLQQVMGLAQNLMGQMGQFAAAPSPAGRRHAPAAPVPPDAA
jgi:hypothetical protein